MPSSTTKLLLLAGLSGLPGEAAGQGTATSSPGGLAPAEKRTGKGWEDFPVFVWRQRYQQEALPEALVEPFGGTNRFRSGREKWIGDAGLDSYVTNAVGRDTLHLDMNQEWSERIERWIDVRDEAVLVREPCLGDPAVRETLFDTLRATLAALPADERGLLGVSIGDEVSLTPNGNPLDLCRSEHCLSLWAEYAAARELPTAPPSTDYVRRELSGEDHSGLGAWLEHRRFHHGRMLELLRELVAEARRHTDLPLGLLGLSGITAFGGVPVREAGELFDFIEVYPLGHHRELASESGADTLATVFLQEERKDAAAWVAWDHWMRGGDGLVVWSDAYLEDQPAHARALAKAVVRIRELEERFSPADPLRPEIAILNDDDCDLASWLRDAMVDGATWPRRLASYHREHGTRESHLRAWLRLLEDSGVQPRVIGPEDAFPKVLIVVDHLVVGKPIQHRLRDHLREGGVVIHQGEFGWITDAGTRRKDPTIKRWSRLFPNLLAPPDGLETYVERRWRPRGASRMRAYGAKLVKRSRHEGPTTLERLARMELQREAADIPWFTSLRPIPALDGRPLEDHFLVCMLPGYADRRERTERMRPWTYRLELPEGLRLVEWLGPGELPEGRVPMGEPLVFVMQDVRAGTLRGR